MRTRVPELCRQLRYGSPPGAWSLVPQVGELRVIACDPRERLESKAGQLRPGQSIDTVSPLERGPVVRTLLNRLVGEVRDKLRGGNSQVAIRGTQITAGRCPRCPPESVLDQGDP
jgi:hypothetical protein